MNKWELAYHLIEAKKNVDSIIYINDNKNELSNMNLQKRIDSLRDDFYISCCILLDNAFRNKKKLWKLKKNSGLIERLYYERDKNSAHSDSDYIPKEYDSLSDLIEEMKLQLGSVKTQCTPPLPTAITLDYVSHDREFFRHLHKLDVNAEENVYKLKYNGEFMTEPDKHSEERPIVQNAGDVKRIPKEERGNYCVVIIDGIDYNEGLQNRQDSAIMANLLFDENIWPNIDQNVQETVNKLKNVGFIDEFGLINEELLTDDTSHKKLERIFKESEYSKKNKPL